MRLYACSKHWQISIRPDVERLHHCIGQSIGQDLSLALKKLVLTRADALLLHQLPSRPAISLFSDIWLCSSSQTTRYEK